MRTVKVIIFFTIILSIFACGKKAAPVPKNTLNLAPPTKLAVDIVISGIKINNLDNSTTLYVEKVLLDESMFPQSRYERVALIKPMGSFVDEEVVKGRFYNYRFANYYPEHRTYSPPVVRGIRFIVQKSLGDVQIETVANSLCITAQMPDEIDYADITINGKFISKLHRNRLCVNAPPTAYIDVMLLPYDNDNYSGVPYQKRIEVDQNTVLLPPQNVKVFQGVDRISLSWDAVKNVDQYYIYKVVAGKKDQLLDKTLVTLYSYKLQKTDTEACVDFKLISVRAGIKSVPVNVSACK